MLSRWIIIVTFGLQESIPPLEHTHDSLLDVNTGPPFKLHYCILVRDPHHFQSTNYHLWPKQKRLGQNPHHAETALIWAVLPLKNFANATMAYSGSAVSHLRPKSAETGYGQDNLSSDLLMHGLATCELKSSSEFGRRSIYPSPTRT